MVCPMYLLISVCSDSTTNLFPWRCHFIFLCQFHSDSNPLIFFINLEYFRQHNNHCQIIIKIVSVCLSCPLSIFSLSQCNRRIVKETKSYRVLFNWELGIPWSNLIIYTKVIKLSLFTILLDFNFTQLIDGHNARREKVLKSKIKFCLPFQIHDLTNKLH